MMRSLQKWPISGPRMMMGLQAKQAMPMSRLSKCKANRAICTQAADPSFFGLTYGCPGLKCDWSSLEPAPQGQALVLLMDVSEATSSHQVLDALSNIPTAVLSAMTPQMLSICLSRLAEYCIMQPEQVHEASGDPRYQHVLACLQDQVVRMCRHHMSRSEEQDCAQEHLSINNVVNMLWALATLRKAQMLNPHKDAGQAPGLNSQLLEAALGWSHAAVCSRHSPGAVRPLADVTTSDLASFLWGLAVLMADVKGESGMLLVGFCGTDEVPIDKLSSAKAGRGPDGAADRLVDLIAEEIHDRLKNEASCDVFRLIDAAWALAVLGSRSANTARCAERVAHELHRCLSNRHSYSVDLDPPEIMKLVWAYASLGIQEVAISRMLDAAAGYVVKRIKARHEAAVRKPSHFSALLNMYAHLKHNSVVIPELIASSASQLVHEIAAEHAGCAVMQDDVQRQAKWCAYLPAHNVLSLLHAYQRLGYYPGQALVTSLLIPLSYQVQCSSSATIAGLMQVMSHMRFTPGELWLRSAMSQVHTGWQQGRATALDLATAFIAAAILNHSPGSAVVQDVCSACLYLDPPDTDPTHPYVSDGTYMSQPLPPDIACQVLFGLLVGGHVDVRRLGMTCYALREDAGRTRQLPDAQLMCVAAAALVLGEEGKEMVDEVLPQDVVHKCWAALRSYLHSCSGTAASLSDVLPEGWCLSQTLQVLDVQVHNPVLKSREGVCQEAFERLPMQATSRQRAWQQLEGLQQHQSQALAYIALDVLTLADAAVNSPSTGLGLATVRARVFECALRETCAGGQTLVKVLQVPVAAGACC